MRNQIIQGDCLMVMDKIPDKSVDMILCDLPYGTTACKWDVIIPFEPLWEQYKRILKPNAAIVLTASQPFTSALVMSNPKWFKYEWIWEKNYFSNFACKNQPGKNHENILVFGDGLTNFFPIKEPCAESSLKRDKIGNQRIKSQTTTCNITGMVKKTQLFTQDGLRKPFSVQRFNKEQSYNNPYHHPTQKPVALFEYLIKTYTNEGDLVLDNCAGSCTTAIACLKTGRDYICIEQLPEYVEIGQKRVDNWHSEHGYRLTLEERVAWLETQVQAQGNQIKKIKDGQLSLWDVG